MSEESSTVRESKGSDPSHMLRMTGKHLLETINPQLYYKDWGFFVFRLKTVFFITQGYS